MTTTAQIIAHSITDDGQEILSFEIEYPRIILAELNTHRALSKNSASSRAIPIQTFIDQIDSNPAMPSAWGMNQAGMQAGEEVQNVAEAISAWIAASKDAIKHSKILQGLGLHKQICNRGLETYQHMKTVITGTSFDNFFHLRNHEAADPTIHVLAMVMLEAYKQSKPRVLLPGEWHVPYYFDGYWTPIDDGNEFDYHGHTLAEALRISSSCCAQTSYRKSDDSLEKADVVYQRLVDAEIVHASPFEHQATPIDCDTPDTNIWCDPDSWEQGVTHMTKDMNLWSGNFCGWIQHRQLIPNHVCMDYQL